jgi:hypothetical protein
MSVATPKQQRFSPRSLNYRSCTGRELYDFMQNRTTLTAAAIRKLNKAEMISHLKTLDTQRTFRRFMDLPPELRLNIYQRALLVDGQQSGKNHSALLRVSRLIHRESEPVLYCENTFCLQIKYPITFSMVVLGACESVWDLRSIKAGVELTRTPIKMDMLLGLRHLTMRMCDLKYYKGDEYTHARLGKHPFWLYRMLTTACLMLSSASRLNTLTITNAPLEGAAWDVNQLAKLLFPVVFLNKTVAIRLDGGSAALHTALDASRRHVHSHRDHYPLSVCGPIISRAIDMLESSRRKVDAGTSSMLAVALDRVFSSEGCLGERDLRGEVARVQTLENIIGKVEAELTALTRGISEA